MEEAGETTSWQRPSHRPYVDGDLAIPLTAGWRGSRPTAIHKHYKNVYARWQVKRAEFGP
jgi:hypothetical protein